MLSGLLIKTIQRKKSNILPVIEAYLDKSANVDALQDWTLEFSFTYGNVDDLIIWRKLKSYTSEKVKEIIIHIPVPSINVIDWGVRDEQFLKKRNVDQRNIKNVDIVVIDPSIYPNRFSYIVDAMMSAIMECFRLGFTVNGKKIILK
jgi:hypothetical protein